MLYVAHGSDHAVNRFPAEHRDSVADIQDRPARMVDHGRVRDSEYVRGEADVAQNETGEFRRGTVRVERVCDHLVSMGLEGWYTVLADDGFGTQFDLILTGETGDRRRLECDRDDS